jgi:hypothetical protein
MKKLEKLLLIIFIIIGLLPFVVLMAQRDEYKDQPMKMSRRNIIVVKRNLIQLKILYMVDVELNNPT